MAPVILTGAGNVTTASQASASSITGAKPSNVADGDTLLAVVYARNSTTTWTSVPSGWATLGVSFTANGTLGVFTKAIPSAATESATTYAWTNSSSAQRLGVVIARVTGLHSTPLDAVGAAATTGTSSITDPAVTAVSADALLVAVNTSNITSASAAVIAAPTGMTEAAAVTMTTGTSTTYMEVAQQTLTVSGSTGTRTAAISPSASSVQGIMFTLAPGPTTVTGTLGATLPALTAAATGTVDGPVVGTISATLPVLTASMAGSSDATRPSVSRAAVLGTGATSGATVTTTNGGRSAGLTWDNVTLGAGTTLTWDTTHGGFYGDRAMRVTSGGTGASAYGRWDAMYRPQSGAPQVATAWLYVPALTATTSVIYVANSTAQRMCELRLATTGKVRAMNSAGTQVLETTAGITLNQWVRVDLLFTPDASAGSLQIKLYNNPASSTPTETTTLATGQNLRQALVEQVYVGNAIAAASVDYWVQAHITDGNPPPFGGGVVVSRWLGAVTDTTAAMAVRTLGVTSIRLAVSTSSSLTSPTYSASQSQDSDGTARLTVSGLTAGTRYFYGLEVDGAIDPDSRGSFRTAPAPGAQTSYTFAAGSCTQNGSNPAIFDTIRGFDPQFFVHLGDLHYRDVTSNDQVAYHKTYDQTLSGPRQSALFGSLPVPYIWSDHDSVGNNGDRTAASVPAANAVLRSRVPGYANRPSTTGCYFSFAWGRVKFVCTDGRSFMDPLGQTDDAAKTKLGATQKAWLLSELTDPAYPVKIWCHDDAISNGSTFAGDDTWSAYNTERTAIFAAIATAGARVAYICGDLHSLGADSGLNVPTAGANSGVPVHVAAALDNTSFDGNGTYSAGTYPTTDGVAVQQFGLFTVTDTGSSIALLFEGRDATTVRVTQTTTWTTPTPVTGSLTATLPALTSAASGNATTAGTLAAALPPVTAAASGNAVAAATIGATLPGLTTAWTGQVTASGAVTAALPAVTASAAGQVVTAGPVAATLPAITAALSGHIDQGAGVMVATLPPLGATVSGAVVTTGTATAALPAIRAALAGSSDAVDTTDIPVAVGPPRTTDRPVGGPALHWPAGPPRVGR